MGLLAVLTAAGVQAAGPALPGPALPALPGPALPALPPLLGSPRPTPTPPAPAPAPVPGPSTAPPQDHWALLVGITDYSGRVSSTVGGANDARLVRDVLLQNGWRADRIRLLVEGQATGAAVAEGMSWLQANSSPTTFSMFHYSGHVKQKNGQEYLWPVDSAFIADTEMVRVLRGIRGTAWTSISGCEAAGFDDGLSSPRHLVTASSLADEKSYEDPETGLSVWTGLFFGEALRRGAGDTDGDGVVTVDEAFAHAAPRATTFTQSQRPYGPQTPRSAGGSGGLRLDAPRI
ncbi:MAG: caspase family protein [Mycobacteriales bacterium]